MSDGTLHNKSNTSNLDKLILDETVQFLYRALPMSAFFNVVIASTLVFILWPEVEHAALLTWLSIMAVINVIRYISYQAYQTKEHYPVEFWDQLFYVLLIMNALSLAAVCIWLLPDTNSIYHYLPILVLIGICAGAVTTLGYKMKNLITYFIIVMGSVIISELLIQTRISNSIAFLATLLFILGLSNAKKINISIVENISLRFYAEENKQILIDSKNEAIEANRDKSRFIALISHELKTPLNGILGYAQLMEMADEPLELSKSESSSLNLKIKEVSLNNILSGSFDILNVLAIELNITLENKIAGNYWVMADEQKLKQIFINLISNALKYNHEHGSVTINANYAEDGKIRVFISDTGNGLTKEQMNSLFIPFRRFDENKEGTGLGLVITKNIVEQMNGNVGVESIVGEGSTFWFELPRVIKKS